MMSSSSSPCGRIRKRPRMSKMVAVEEQGLGSDRRSRGGETRDNASPPSVNYLLQQSLLDSEQTAPPTTKILALPRTRNFRILTKNHRHHQHRHKLRSSTSRSSGFSTPGPSSDWTLSLLVLSCTMFIVITASMTITTTTFVALVAAGDAMARSDFASAVGERRILRHGHHSLRKQNFMLQHKNDQHGQDDPGQGRNRSPILIPADRITAVVDTQERGMDSPHGHDANLYYERMLEYSRPNDGDDSDEEGDSDGTNEPIFGDDNGGDSNWQNVTDIHEADENIHDYNDDYYDDYDADNVVDIDCERFQHLEQEMPQCQDEADFDHVFVSGGESDQLSPQSPPYEVHLQFDLVVLVPLSLLDELETEVDYMYGLPPRMHKLARLAIATVVTRILDDLTDYHVVLRGDQSWTAKQSSRKRRRNRSRMLHAQTHNEHDSNTKYQAEVSSHNKNRSVISNGTASEEYIDPTVDHEEAESNSKRRRVSDEDEEEEEEGEDEESEEEEEEEKDDEDEESDNKFPVSQQEDATNNAFDDDEDPNFDPSRPWKDQISLLHKWTWLHLHYDSDNYDRRHLWEEQADLSTQLESTKVLPFRVDLLYRAKWEETRTPVLSSRLMDEIKYDCKTTMSAVIEDGTYLRAVGRSIDHIKYFTFDRNGVAIERYSRDDDQLSETENIIFFGVRTIDNSSSSELDYSAPPPKYGDEGGLFQDPASTTVEASRGTFYEPLEVEWGVREWCGAAMVTTTLLLAMLLSTCARFLSRRQKLHELWGSILTEQGVAELLQVGWRYHDDGKLAETSSTPQIFLQVYDRRRSNFYNDENSMLHGGAEQEFFVQTGLAAAALSSTHPTSAMTSSNRSHTDTESKRSKKASVSCSGASSPPPDQGLQDQSPLSPLENSNPKNGQNTHERENRRV